MDLLNKSILIVEDNIEIQDYVIAVLSELMISVTVANNGIEALKILNNIGHFDLILLDIMMPEMDGFEFLSTVRNEVFQNMKLKPIKITGQKDVEIDLYFGKQMKEFSNKIKDIPVVMLTAKDDKEQVLKAKKLNVSGFLVKPMDAKRLLKQVHKLLS